MTKEEARVINELYKTCQISDDIYEKIMSVAQYERKVDDVLSKISTEIEHYDIRLSNYRNMISIDAVLQIIDKYIIAERNDK